ncbi:HGL210Cp [Eremothecium sinecaudum]|uniref:HGL210Cp n=1 Tax=Eremothecium sinecaudum TaxID=45286 RepID=A0A0X8HVG0_9SACH|nr:HGL210Cp [Eremothecium sinecaudum]AMD22130.1 HGL210Cp [Eremothecium sinecaudum]
MKQEDEEKTNSMSYSDDQADAESPASLIDFPAGLDARTMLQKAESLARTLSQHTTRNGPLEIDENDFDMHAIMAALVRDYENQNIYTRQMGVIMENVTVNGIDTSCTDGSNFGDILALPLTVGRKLRAPKHIRNILVNIDMLVRPGEMVLVLGRPGSGCSSLLRAAAGDIEQFTSVNGVISYDGISQKEVLKNFKADVIYNGEQDVHFPHLTVRQTLDFALACKTPNVRVNGMSRKEYITMMRDLYATVFGLKHTYDTKVGDDFVRGVSGGERKRVSIAEALAADASVYCWDNATRGLDASTALEYAHAIRTLTNILKSSSLVTLYQASERIYQLFDKVTVLYEGRQIYFGDVLSAKEYFQRLGYVCPSRQSTTEFLTSVTDPNGYHEVLEGYEDLVPRTAAEFEERWRSSPEYQRLKSDTEEYKALYNSEQTREQLKRSKLQKKSKFSRKKSSYTLSFAEQVRLCTVRGFQRIYGDKAYTVTNIVAASLQAIITGTLFFQSSADTIGAFSRGGVLYFSVLYYSLMGLASLNFSHRPILQKHKNYMLYHPGAEALASNIAAFTFRFIGLIIFLILLYFLSGLTPEAGRFFMVLLFMVIASESVITMFESLAAMCDTLSQANAAAGVIMLGISMYSTYMIQEPSMHPWFKWISYVLPIKYAFEALLNTEFHNRYMKCDQNFIPQGPGYENVSADNRVCAFLGSKPGMDSVLGDDYLKVNYGYTYSHQWRNFGILVLFWIGFMVIKCVATELKQPVKGMGETLVFKKGTLKRRAQLKADPEDKIPGNLSESKMLISSDASADPSSMFEGLTNGDIFMWKDVSYTVPTKTGMRKLLNNVSGFCAPGTLTALMGESGAGKTTLLNTLAQRNVGIITGDMLVNGLPIDASFERKTGYVQQQDVHTPELTVRESLQFSARLRRPQSVPEQEKMEYVEKIIDVFGMSDFADALVGKVGCGLNVEQRKKLSIAVELAAKPSLLLFLDEPTSGLDSQSAWAVVSLLKKLAATGQAILCTIHQPSATLFEQFDRLLLLKKGGETTYFGDIGEHSSTIVQYFERNGARKCSPSENPAEYILEAIGAGATASVKEDWGDIWRNSPEFVARTEELDKLCLSSRPSSPVIDNSLTSKFSTSYLYQFRYTLMRTGTIFYRDLNYLMAKQMLFIVGGLFVGFSFFDIASSFKGLQNMMFAIFMTIIISAPSMNQIQERAHHGKELYNVRESKSNMFHWSLVLITEFLVELPYQLFFATLFFLCGFLPLRSGASSYNQGIFYLNFAVLFQFYVVGLGLCVLYLAPNLETANVILGLILSFLLSFCGVTQPMNLMPKFWKFMYYASPYTYFVQTFLGLTLHGREVVCKPEELSFLNPPSGMTCGQYMSSFVENSSGYITNPDETSNCGYCIYKTGDEFLTTIGANYNQVWRNFGLLWGYAIFNVVAMLTFYWLFHIKRIHTKIRMPFSNRKSKVTN